MTSGAPLGSIVTNVAEKLGLLSRGSDEADRELPDPVEVALDIRVPDGDNAVWGSFESLEVILTELRFHASDGSTETVSTGVQFPVRDEKYVDGDELAWGMRIEPGTYEELSVTFEVADYDLQEGEAELPVEGFDDARLSLNDGGPFAPAAGEEWRFTLDVVVREDDAGDAYVLEPAIEWH